MKTVYILKYLSLAILFLAGCTSQQGIFGNKSAHEKYSSGLDNAGLSNTRLGKEWKSAAESALSSPAQVTLPYKEAGYFETDIPRSAGYAFTAKRGERIIVNVQTTPAKGFLLFFELWNRRTGQSPELLAAADTSTNKLEWDVKENEQYIVRLQPELLQSAGYIITITTGPSLAFPIQKMHNPRVISVWGDPRDGNARKHEGIDILAKKHTPVVAVSNGVVTNVKENGLGGKVVFFRPNGKDFNLYYAHLDTQLVTGGQRVNAGEPLGTVGNTGNAKNTVAHLHFGIYAQGGAVDPLPFVNDNRPAPKPINTDTSLLASIIRIKSSSELLSTHAVGRGTGIKLLPGQAIKTLAATNEFYYVQLPTKETGFVKKDLVTNGSIRKISLLQTTDMLDYPNSLAAVKKQLKAGQDVVIWATSGNFSYITAGKDKGWINTTDLPK